MRAKVTVTEIYSRTYYVDDVSDRETAINVLFDQPVIMREEDCVDESTQIDVEFI